MPKCQDKTHQCVTNKKCKRTTVTIKFRGTGLETADKLEAKIVEATQKIISCRDAVSNGTALNNNTINQINTIGQILTSPKESLDVLCKRISSDVQDGNKGTLEAIKSSSINPKSILMTQIMC